MGSRPTAPLTARKQRYLEDTVVLQADVVCDGGAYRITQFMRPELKRTELIRIVEGLEGRVEMADVALTPWTAHLGCRPMRAGVGPVVLTAVAFAAIGPKLVGPHDKAAGAPFVYQPPAGFVERAPGSGSSSNAPIDMTGKTPAAPKPARPEGEREWTAPPAAHASFVPTITLDHSKTKSTVEEPDLAQIEAGFPDMFAKEGISWTPVRRETHVRPGGERVGVIEGECTKKSIGEIAPGIAATLHYRRLILVFPDDAGSSIVTALYGYDEVAKWQPAFEASINQAQGVATRLPPAPAWLYAAWGAAGLVLGWLASALIGSRRSPEPAARKDST